MSTLQFPVYRVNALLDLLWFWRRVIQDIEQLQSVHWKMAVYNQYVCRPNIQTLQRTPLSSVTIEFLPTLHTINMGQK